MGYNLLGVFWRGQYFPFLHTHERTERTPPVAAGPPGDDARLRGGLLRVEAAQALEDLPEVAQVEDVVALLRRGEELQPDLGRRCVAALSETEQTFKKE